MTNKQTGYIAFIAAIGMMLGLIALDIGKLSTWGEMTTPAFVAALLGHLASVITAFVGGKMIPTEPQDQRKNDK